MPKRGRESLSIEQGLVLQFADALGNKDRADFVKAHLPAIQAGWKPSLNILDSETALTASQCHMLDAFDRPDENGRLTMVTVLAIMSNASQAAGAGSALYRMLILDSMNFLTEKARPNRLTCCAKTTFRTFSGLEKTKGLRSS